MLTNDQEFHGTLIENFYDSLSFVLKSISHQSRKKEIIRSEGYYLPVEALREFNQRIDGIL